MRKKWNTLICLSAGLLIGGVSLLTGETEMLDSIDAYMEAAGDDAARLKTLIQEQRAAGAPAGLLLEAEVLYAFRSGDYGRAGALASALADYVEANGVDGLELFGTEESAAAMIEALRGQAALEAGDVDGFKGHVTEAFWLDPNLGSILGDWIGEVRQKERMATLTVPMDTEIVFSNGETTSLARLAEGKKAVLLDFWASWCGPCIQLMPELKAKAEKLEPQGVVVAGMNTEGVSEAESFRQEREIDITWLVEPDDRVFSRLLAIDSIPRMILLTPEGKVLFNGHPMDASLEDALAEVGAAL